MIKLIVMFFIKLRWAYFHVNPSYLKFTLDNDAYFQHSKTGVIHCNYSWNQRAKESDDE